MTGGGILFFALWMLGRWMCKDTSKSPTQGGLLLRDESRVGEALFVLIAWLFSAAVVAGGVYVAVAVIHYFWRIT
jgi:hypothetical protein